MAFGGTEMARHIKRMFGLLTFLIAAAPALADDPAEAPDVEDKDHWLVVHAGTLLTIPGDAPRNEQTLVVHNDRVHSILNGYIDAPDVTLADAESDIEILDLRDYFVLPGLMDMHVHLSFEYGGDEQAIHGAADDYVSEHAAAKDDVYQFVTALTNAQKTLQAGYTTVRNVGSSGWHMFALRDAISEGNLIGPRIIVSGHTIRIGADSGSGACVSVESCRRATREQIDMGAELIKVYATCSGGKPCGTKNAPSVFMEDEIRAVVDTAATRELGVAAHAHGTAGINLAAAVGVSSVEHGSYNSKESHRIMKKNDVFLVSTLSVQDNIRNEIEEATGPMLDVMQGFIDNHGPGMLVAHHAGVRLAAGSDAGVTKHGNNMRELEFYVEFGLTPTEAIVAATVNAAELLGMEEDLGTLQAGFFADFIASKSNPLNDISALREIDIVVKSGEIVKSELTSAQP